MSLKIYNTFSRGKDEFKPLKAGQVGMYVCGPTVYDHSHIGHARAYVVFDTILRTLRHLGYNVHYVRNLTDIDDKIIKRANDEGCDAATIAKRYIDSYHEDMAALGLLPPDAEPRATGTIPEMIALIEDLFERKIAYCDGGDVYYSVSAFPAYCALSGRDLDDLKSGARVAVEEKKRDPLDFVLWKMSKPGEPAWDSPWGAGRPGWHIECSAMSRKFLGQPIDIHGGGHDLIFPHHENEIAQSEGASGKQFVRYWIHNGFVNVNKEKMSKSLGNFSTIKDLLAAERAEALRLFLLSVHYRSPLDFSLDGVHESRRALDRLYNCLLFEQAGQVKDDKAVASYQDKFRAALEDDFNTAKALAVLFEAAKEVNRLAKKGRAAGAVPALIHFIRSHGQDYLGILHEDAKAWFQQSTETEKISAERIEQLIAERRAAREKKDFARADAIRAELSEAGVLLEDGAGGTSWKWQT